MSVDCCGSIRKTPYCPLCGKRLISRGLPALIAYLERQADLQVRLAKGGLGAEGRLQAAERFKAWAKGVQDMIKRNRPGKARAGEAVLTATQGAV